MSTGVSTVLLRPQRKCVDSREYKPNHQWVLLLAVLVLLLWAVYRTSAVYALALPLYQVSVCVCVCCSFELARPAHGTAGARNTILFPDECSTCQSVHTTGLRAPDSSRRHFLVSLTTSFRIFSASGQKTAS